LSEDLSSIKEVDTKNGHSHGSEEDIKDVKPPKEETQPNSSVNKSDEEEKKDSRAQSHYEELVHPNMMKDEDDNSSMVSDAKKPKYAVGASMRHYNQRKKRDCKYFFSKLDYEILRPLLIYKYEREEMHRQDEYIDMMLSNQKELQEAYSRVDHDELRKSSASGAQSIQEGRKAA